MPLQVNNTNVAYIVSCSVAKLSRSICQIIAFEKPVYDVRMRLPISE